jgi:urea carboxylase-associated protein 2
VPCLIDHSIDNRTVETWTPAPPRPSTTATTTGARDHARAQAATRVRAMPTLPASDATALPAGVDAASVVWDEVLDPGEYAAHRLPRGATLQLTDLEGEACAHLLVHNAQQTAERLNPADTVKVQWQAYLTTGSRLLSDMGRALMTILEDSSGRHDALCSAPGRLAHEDKFGDGAVQGPFPNARDRLIVAALKAGLERRDVGPSISFFKGPRVEPDGTLTLDLSDPRPGATVTMRCELDVQVAITNVPHALDRRPAYVCTPVRITAWRPTEPAGHIAESPEMARAMLNNADWLGGMT